MTPDYFTLAKEARKLDVRACTQTVRLALLGDFATQHLTAILRVLFCRSGIDARIFEAEYDAIASQAFDPGSQLYAHAPEAIVLLNSTARLRARYYGFGDDKSAFAATMADEIASVWDAIAARTQVPIVQSTYVLPTERLFGNYDNKVDASLYACVRQLNSAIVDRARQRPQILLNDLDYIASYVGRKSWFDETLWMVSKSLCALEHLPLVARNIVDIVLATRGTGVKCIVLDLDNTLWGGVVGDDGVEGIRLGHLGDGEAFEVFQSYLRELRRRGILLAVCSKNDHETAMRVFREHPHMVLREDDIAVFVANWENKVDNLIGIQATLKIGFDSMVFLDDNPFERGFVRQRLPEVIVPELPEDPANYVACLSELNLFETTTASAVDRDRTATYRTETRRVVERASFANLDDYLQSLQMTITIRRFDRFHLPRIAQLIQRSNQFNLTTRRYSEAECESLMTDTESIFPFWASLTDRFGDNGLILVAICRFAGDDVEIDSFLMSCRVLQRGVEQQAMNTIVDAARQRGARRVIGRYVPTAKNAMVKSFYRQFGFQQMAEEADGTTTFALDVAAYVPIPVWMETQ